MSDYKKELFGHTVEVRGSGTGSLDPWAGDYARSIDLSLMCTADMAEFMLIDGDHIYKFHRWNAARELHELLDSGIIESWEQFENEWLKPNLEKPWTLEDWGSLAEHKKSLDKSKKRSNVWKSIPEKKKREVYEYLKTLSREETEKWYEDKFKELEIE